MKKPLFLIIFVLATFGLFAQIHVSPVASGSGDGTSWANATTLEHAVTSAGSGSILWVQEGTYNLSATLVIPQGVRLYGGFLGTENQVGQRDFAENPTIIDANHNFAAVTLGELSVMNGFTIRNGVANIPTRMNGGGVLMRAGSRIESSYIINNVALHSGGGVFVENDGEIYNSVIADNSAGFSGFAVAGDEVLFRSNTVVGNTLLDCNMYMDEIFERAICIGETIELSTPHIGTYLWSTGETSYSLTITPLTDTTITATITLPNFCVVVETFEITVNPIPTVTVSLDRTSANPGEMVTFTATAEPSGGNFLWNNSSNSTDSVLVAPMPDIGDLQFTVNYELNGCEADSVTTTATNTYFYPGLIDEATLIAYPPAICVGDSVLIRLEGGIRNSSEWVLYVVSRDATDTIKIDQSIYNAPSFWVHPTENTTYLLRGEGGGVPTEWLSVEIIVNSLPSPPMPSITSICVGETVVFNTGGTGTWAPRGLFGRLVIVPDSDTANLITVIGLDGGVGVMIFTDTNECQAFFDLEVLDIPIAIVGDTNFCQGEERVFTSTPIGGTWSVVETGETSATVDATGHVTASTPLTGVTGPTTIRYTHPDTRCYVSQVVYVHTQPVKSLPYTNQVCVGDSITLRPGYPIGGIWSVASSDLAEFSADTILIGLFAGEVVVRYQLNVHCFDTLHITVLQNVTGLSYVSELCEEGTSTATATPVGGTWSIAETIATVDPTSGQFTGVTAGNFSLVYTLENGCERTSTRITVHPTPTEITGDSAVGVGLTVQLSSSPTNGVWSSLHPEIANVDPDGLVLGISAGMTVVSYTLDGGNCHRNFTIHVHSCPTLELVSGTPGVTHYEVCLHVPITEIQYVLTNADTTRISWTNHAGDLIDQPAGISFNTTTHTINGTPTVSGTFIYTITSVDHASVCPPVSISGSIIVFDTVLPGAIDSSQAICFGDTPFEFECIISGSGGNPIGARYQWQSSIDG
ncbi:MAG: DUF1565 domain-containing protein, partial [Bacteroidales bacterium]|nr:DUF1565 domain-containing protein [Bacteroidales bacterium]